MNNKDLLANHYRQLLEVCLRAELNNLSSEFKHTGWSSAFKLFSKSEGEFSQTSNSLSDHTLSFVYLWANDDVLVADKNQVAEEKWTQYIPPRDTGYSYLRAGPPLIPPHLLGTVLNQHTSSEVSVVMDYNELLYLGCGRCTKKLYKAYLIYSLLFQCAGNTCY